MDWNSLALVTTGGLLGIIPAMAGTWSIERSKRKALAAAFAAEISAVIDGTEKRGLVDYFQGFVAQWEKGEWLDQRPSFVGVENIAQSYPVYQANIDKVGSLGKELAADVVLVYATFLALRNDVMEAERAGPEKIEWVINLIREDLNIWREVSVRGRELVDRLHRAA